ncbi:hypothetical protein GCM10010343_12610 [Streptomyces avidinii]|nr:hypothetical protein GCM10010343_12610 [Streptomyces avidinii]
MTRRIKALAAPYGHPPSWTRSVIWSRWRTFGHVEDVPGATDEADKIELMLEEPQDRRHSPPLPWGADTDSPHPNGSRRRLGTADAGDLTRPAQGRTAPVGTARRRGGPVGRPTIHRAGASRMTKHRASVRTCSGGRPG